MLLKLKRWLKRFAIVAAIVLLGGLLLPSDPIIPVDGATSADWNEESFWYHPWGRSGTQKGIDIFAAEETAVFRRSGSGFSLSHEHFCAPIPLPLMRGDVQSLAEAEVEERRWEQIQELFGKAMDLPRDEREAFLLEACGDDNDLLEQVRSLLRYDTQSEATIAGAVLEGATPGDLIGTQLGPFEVQERIGEGGFGTVYRARQSEPLERDVAIKVVRWDRDGRDVLRRFEAERQALAKMEHPGIASVFEAGSTEQGKPYFVMELVRGTPITDYCDQKSLSIAERLNLFTEVCDAVQHAHQKGIIHRDLKPSNILIVENGGARPKVIDFGISKAAAPKIDQETVLTQVGQLVGTPSYMSPEQASGQDVDTRSDVYALGVLLYELLTGTTPIRPDDLRGAAWGEVERAIREQDPPKPSSRVETATVEIAAQRSTQPISLSRDIRGDLDWIVMRALEKDRDRRYNGAAAFAEDVRRHLSSEPVLAGPPSASYRFSKFVRRNRQSVIAASIALVALVGGLVAATVGFMEASRERDRAQAEAEKSTQVSEFLVDLFSVSDPSESRGNSVTARELLDMAVTTMRTELKDQPEVRSELLHTMGNVYLRLGLHDEAMPLLQSALDERQQRLGLESADTQLSMLAVSRTHAEMAVYDEALRLAEEAEAGARAAFGEEHPNTLKALEARANILVAAGKALEGHPIALQVLEVRRRTLGDKHEATATSLHNLGLLKFHLSEYNEAATYVEEALAIRRELFGEDHPDTLNSLKRLAITRMKQGNVEEAGLLAKQAVDTNLRVLGPDHIRTLESQHEYAGILVEMARYKEAIEIHQENHDRRRNSLGENHPHVFHSLNGIGNAYFKLGDFENAAKYHTETLALKAANLGESHPSTMITRGNLAAALTYLGNYEAAEKTFLEMVALETERLGAKNAETLRLKSNLAIVYRYQRKYDASEKILLEVLDDKREVIGADHPSTMTTAIALGHLYSTIERFDEAVEMFEHVIQVRRRVFGEKHPYVAVALGSVAYPLRKTSRLEEAKSALDQALEIYLHKENEGNPNLVKALEQYVYLAEAMGDDAKKDEMIAWIERLKSAA